MNRFEVKGYTFTPHSSKKFKSKLIINNNKLSIKIRNQPLIEKLEIEKVFDSNAGINKKIYFKNNFCFEVEQKLPNEDWDKIINRKNYLKTLEKFSFKKSIFFILLIILTIPLIKKSVPSLINKMVYFIPLRFEQEIGKVVFTSLEKQYFQESGLDNITINDLSIKYKKILKKLELETYHKLYIKQSKSFGANAFSLPGGIIVVTDELIKTLKYDDLIVSVICHELAHSTERHSLKNILNFFGFWFVVEFIFFNSSDFLIEGLLSLGSTLMVLENSREFEIDADQLAVVYLKKISTNPENLILALKKLTKDESKIEIEWLSTHPNIDYRIELIDKKIKEINKIR